jgi:hypothetical protein
LPRGGAPCRCPGWQWLFARGFFVRRCGPIQVRVDGSIQDDRPLCALVAPLTLEVAMGTRGPIPERSEARRRRNKDDGPELVQAPPGPPAELPALPEPDELWHPIASDWYLSLRESGQSQFYEPSDWAMARYAAELMSRLLSSDRAPNGQLVAALDSVMARLLTTEGDRRRARIELERKPAVRQAPAGVTAIADYQARIGG